MTYVKFRFYIMHHREGSNMKSIQYITWIWQEKRDTLILSLFHVPSGFAY